MTTRHSQVFFRDAELDASWSSSPKQYRHVGDVRCACEKRAEYRDFLDRSPGFLRLSFRGDELVDDCVAFRSLGYPKLAPDCAHPELIEVRRRGVRLFRVSWPPLSRDRQFHDRTRVSHLRPQLCRRYRIPAADLEFRYSDDHFLRDLPDTTVKFRVRHHCVLTVEMASKSHFVVFPVRRPVCELVAYLQATAGDWHRARSFKVFVSDRRLRSSDIIPVDSILRVAEGRPIPTESVAIPCDFPPRRVLDFPKAALLLFVQNVIAMLAGVPYRSVNLHPLTDGDLRRTVGQVAPALLRVGVPLISVLFRTRDRPPPPVRASPFRRAFTTSNSDCRRPSAHSRFSSSNEASSSRTRPR